MNLNKFHNKKVHKIRAKKHITLMLIQDPTKSARVLKFPKAVRFLAYALIIVATWGVLHYLQYVTDLESQLATNQYNILVNSSVIQEKNQEINGLSATNLEHDQKLLEYKALSAELDRKLTDLEIYKETLDTKLNGAGETVADASPQQIEEIPVVQGDSIVELSDDYKIPEASFRVAAVSDQEFDQEIDRLINDTKQAIAELEESLTTYEVLGAKLNELIPYWEAYPCGAPVSDTHISSDFGWRSDPLYGYTAWHNGVDFDVKYQPVYATGKGTVVFAGYKPSFGYMIILDHGYGFQSAYAHLSDIEVAEGDVVLRGDEIAVSGRSGRVTGAHLHYEILENGVNVDPENYIE